MKINCEAQSICDSSGGDDKIKEMNDKQYFPLHLHSIASKTSVMTGSAMMDYRT